MKKICHLTSVHPSKDTRIFYKECISLAKAGYDVKLIVVNQTSETIEGVEIISVKCNYKYRTGRIIKAPKLVYKKAIEINADVYHFHDPELLPYALKLKKKGKKVIYDVHEDVPRQILSKHWIPSLLRKPVAKILEWYENKLSKEFDVIITATDYIKDRFCLLNINTIVVRNYPLIETIPIPLEWSHKKKEICYIGAISKIRGITQIVNAMSFSDNIQLNMAGNYANNDYRKILSSIQGWDKIIEHGFVSREETKEILRCSIAGLVLFLPYPNHTNALPNKIFEYMIAGIPVIASNFPFWKEIIENNNCGICVNPLNPEEIADAINYLINNVEIAKEMGLNGRKAVEEKYNWHIEEKQLLDLYFTILS